MARVAVLLLLSLSSVVLPHCTGNMSTAMNVTATNDTATNGTVCDEFDPGQQKALSAIRGASGIICLILTAIVLFVFVCGNRLCGDHAPCKNFRRRLVLFITISTIFFLIFFILQLSVYLKETAGENHKSLCKAIGFFIQYFGWQELGLVSTITVYFFYIFVMNGTTDEESPVKCAEIILYIALIIFPAVPAGLVFINNGYGETRGWCWIRLYNSDCTSIHDGIVGQMLGWYFWCMLCGVGTILVFILAMCCNAKNPTQRAANKELQLLLSYPFIFLAVNAFELASWIVTYTISDNLPIGIFWGFYAALSPVSAAVIPITFAILYICNKKVGYHGVQSL